MVENSLYMALYRLAKIKKIRVVLFDEQNYHRMAKVLQIQVEVQVNDVAVVDTDKNVDNRLYNYHEMFCHVVVDIRNINLKKRDDLILQLFRARLYYILYVYDNIIL